MPLAPLHERRRISAPQQLVSGAKSALVKGAVVGALALAASALVNRHLARRAERDNPPRGRFLNIDGLHLHFLERGEGPALVLLHGNGTTSDDFESSGLLDLAARKYRVIAFDRPGFGHTNRPGNIVWTPEAQAQLICKAMRQLGVKDAVVLGHSWGASVAIALALMFPRDIAGLVLASGYYYPSARLDALLMSPPALPFVGSVLSYTLAPVIGRAIWHRVLHRVFGPEPVPAKFSAFPRELAFRPSQLQASAGEAAMMIPNAIVLREQYRRLKMPVSIIAGTGDRVSDAKKQSAMLHRVIPQSRFYQVRGGGHMVHQTATSAVMMAIDGTANELKAA